MVLLPVLFVAFIRPSQERDWVEDFRYQTTFIEKTTGKYSAINFRNWQWDTSGASKKDWMIRDIDITSIRELWFFFEPFEGNSLAGHTFLSFVYELPDGSRDAFSVSVEARKESHENYSGIKGIFRQYELTYSWTPETDILSRIAVYLDHPVYAYQIDISESSVQNVFRYFVERSNDIAHQPRFYNTIHSNCTNELAKSINLSEIEALDWNISWILTGKSAKWLYENGYLKTDEADFEILRKKSNIQDHVKQFIGNTNFSSDWREK